MYEGAKSPFILSLPKTSAGVPLLVTSPHSGSDYPADFLHASQLDAHEIRQSEDMYVNAIYADAPKLGVALLAARFPRAYIDLNRAPYELEQALFADKLPDHIDTKSMRAAAGLGTVPRLVAENTPIYKAKLPFAEAERRIETIYHPFHAMLDQQLDALYDAHGYSLLVDAHSMPSQATRLSGMGEIDFVLGNRHGRACHNSVTRAVESFLTSRGWRVGLNKPYAGGHITEQYGIPARGRHALQIEINRGIYMDETSHEKHDGFMRLRQDMQELMAHLIAILPDMADDLMADTHTQSAAE